MNDARVNPTPLSTGSHLCITSSPSIPSYNRQATSALADMLNGLYADIAVDAELVEILSRHDAWKRLVPMVVARPPVSVAALRCLRAGMEQVHCCNHYYY